MTHKSMFLSIELEYGFQLTCIYNDYCSSPSTKHSHPAAILKMPLRQLTSASVK